MPYTLKFSDVSKNENIIVPDMPPGVNNIDTSLSLIGKNYPNYGEKISQNFLSLLENFASPLPPVNPIEGQLWYDTSDPTNKVLRVMDGTADSTRWPTANGIYQQGFDPKNTASPGLKVGDIWVDTQNNLLKIYHSGEWTTVGPSVSSGDYKTGAEPSVFESTTGTTHNVLLNYVNGSVISIVSDTDFVPKTIIDGFPYLVKGINLKGTDVLNGTAAMSYNVRIGNYKYAAQRLLIKDDFNRQEISSKIFFKSSLDQSNSQGNDGIVIDYNPLENNSYIQFYKFENDAVILNNSVGGKIAFKTKSNLNSNLVTGLIIENNSVSINTVTNSLYALDVNGSLRISGNLVLTSTGSSVLTVAGGFTVQKDLIVNKSLTVEETANISDILTVGSGILSGTAILPDKINSLDIGSPTNYFRSLYISSIGSASSGTIVYGNVIGTARGLYYSSEFKLQGQVTATSFIFAGTGSQATFNTELTPTAITEQPYIDNVSNSLTILSVDTSTSAAYQGLGKISREKFIEGIVPSGTMVAYGGSGAPVGWLPCDGSLQAIEDYPTLYSVIGGIYGTAGVNFYVPDMRYATTSTIGQVNYIIKI